MIISPSRPFHSQTIDIIDSVPGMESIISMIRPRIYVPTAYSECKRRMLLMRSYYIRRL